MFKSLLATVFFTASLGAPKRLANPITQENSINDVSAERIDNYADKSNTIQGQYTLNDTLDFSWSESSTFYSISIQDYTFRYNPVAMAYVHSYNDVYAVSLCSIYINCYMISGNPWVTFNYDVYDCIDDSVLEFEYSFTGVNEYSIQDYLDTSIGDDLVYNFKNADIYIIDSFTFTSEVQRNFFYTLFHKVDFNYSNYTFYGAYVLRDEPISYDNVPLILYSEDIAQNLNDVNVWGYFDTYIEYNNQLTISPCRISVTGGIGENITYNNTSYGVISSSFLMVQVYDTFNNFSYDTDLTIDQRMNYDITVVGQSVAEKLMFCFSDSVYFNGFWGDFFNTFFSKVPNRYYVVYTGWYTFLPNPYRPFDVFGSLMVNNTLYNRLHGYTLDASPTFYIDSLLYTSQNNLVTPLYNGTTWTLQNRRFYLSGVFIPITMYNNMQDNGSFDYLPSGEQFTITELIFAVVDAPVKMLTDLFNVELLGVRFYVAFMGIVTIIMIMFILRKVI